MQLWPSWLACLTPFHDGAALGGRHRSSPTGGAADRTPSNTRTRLEESTRPASAPPSTVTRGPEGAASRSRCCCTAPALANGHALVTIAAARTARTHLSLHIAAVWLRGRFTNH